MSLIDDYSSGESVNSIANRLGISWRAAKAMLLSYGLKIRTQNEQAIFRRVISDEKVLSLLKSGMTCAEIATQVGCDSSAIQRKANRLNFPIKGGKRVEKTKFVFNEWNHLLAYTVGLILGDGAMSNPKDQKHPNQYQVSVSLISSDKSHLDHLSKLWQGRTIIRVESCHRIILGSKTFHNFLTSIGMLPIKNSMRCLPAIPDEFFNSFLCGWFDADGSVWFKNNKRHRPQFNLVSKNISLLEDASVRLFRLTGIETILAKGHKTYRLRIHALSKVMAVAQFMYAKTPLCLERKRGRFFSVPKQLALKNIVK